MKLLLLECRSSLVVCLPSGPPTENWTLCPSFGRGAGSGLVDAFPALAARRLDPRGHLGVDAGIDQHLDREPDLLELVLAALGAILRQVLLLDHSLEVGRIAPVRHA